MKDYSKPHSLEYLDIHRKVRADGRPNFCGLQLPGPSKLNSEQFFEYLSDYWDWQIPFFVKFRFPLYIDRNNKLQSDLINHKSALQFPDHVEHSLKEEIQHQAILGPFSTPPIPLHTSFLTREKSGLDKRRVIVGLSWPQGASVNDAVDDSSYMWG